MKLIRDIEIKNFRSFGNRRGETSRVNKVEHLNVISGANDSGKSNILRALNLFFNGYTDINQFFRFDRDFFKKDATDDKDIKEEVVTIKVWFSNSNNSNKNQKKTDSVFLPEEFWVSKKWKKTSEFSQCDTSSNIQLSFKHEKGEFYEQFLDETGEQLKSQIKASLQKQLTDFLGSIQFHYIPAIKDKEYFSHLFGELQQSLWKAKVSKVDIKKNDFEKEIQKETILLMNEFKDTLNHPTLSFNPAFQLPQNLIDLFRTLQVQTGAVDLRYRGDGVQAKLIPEILFFIADKEKSFTTRTVRTGEQAKKFFVWGFEEPENSYEYKNAQLLADRFKNKFIEQAQIFITTHSFNFISMVDENVGRYRVWQSTSSPGSKIAKIKESNNGRITFEKMGGDEDVLLEELGFFELNKKMLDAYTEAIKTKEYYEQKMGEVSKPILYTEGNNTEYLTIAKTLFGSVCDYELESLGGKNDMKNIFTQFSTANFCRYKVIFVFDCDAEKEFDYCENIQTKHLIPYRLKRNKNNTIEEIQSGIENMFDCGLFEDKFFSVKETYKDGEMISKSRTLKKDVFLENIKTNYAANKSVFYNFETIQKFIDNQLT